MEFNTANIYYQSAKRAAETLIEAGFIAYFAGGCVRDLLLAREPHDFDIATNARPEQIEALFEKTLPIGKAFGIILVVIDHIEIEVASFRKDGLYIDGRRPEGVFFSTLEEDARRRDFTMNGLYFDLQNKKIIDLVGGVAAIQKKTIQSIGDAANRFEEDQLRLLRAVRFQAQLNFDIEEMTLKALEQHAQKITNVSGERIYSELEKIITAPFFERALLSLVNTGLLAALLKDEAVIWRSPQAYFRVLGNSAEDRWVSFFLWLNIILKNGASLHFFESLAIEFKFSKDLKRKTLKSMQWIFEKEVFLNHRFGELIEKSFESENQRGLLLYETFLLSASEREAFLRFEKCRDFFKGQRPEAIVQSVDLSAQFSGANLGTKLRESFWLQLEEPALSKAQILQKIGMAS